MTHFIHQLLNESMARSPRAEAAAVLLSCAALIGTVPVHAAAAAAHYFDGGVVRAISIDPQWVAYIQPTPAPLSEFGQAKSTAAAQLAPLVTLRLASQPISRSAGTLVTSPVYREGNSPAGRLMALPGGVLVKMQADWDLVRVQAWAASKGLAVSPRMAVGGNWYLISTEAGAPALELANALQQSGEVVYASPNWWKQTDPR